MVATPQLLQINTGFTGDFSLLLSNNANTGGTCFGDSGGPNFVGSSTVVGAVTSYAVNGNCAGTGGVFRVDRSWSLDWLKSAFGATCPARRHNALAAGAASNGAAPRCEAKDPSIEGRRQVLDAQAVGPTRR